MIAMLFALIAATDAVYRSVAGFTPSPSYVALPESDTEGLTSSPTSVALIASATEEPTSSPTESYISPYSDYYYEPHPDYPDCDVPEYYINDSYCDDLSNTAECGWDGGDCCECTCKSDSRYGCYTWNYDCQDPEAQLLFEATGCTAPSLTKPEVSPCPPEVQAKWVVNNTEGATLLAEAIFCSRGNFDVTWMRHVNVTKTIYVLDGVSLNITGASDAVMDGGGKVRVLLVSNGQLYLQNLEIINGNGSEGGAIFAGPGSELFVDGASFSSNIAQNMGGAVYIESSNVTLVSNAFDGNSAVYGGAMYVVNSTVTRSVNVSFRGNNAENGGAIVIANSNVTWSEYTTFISNNATKNGGALLITGSSYVGWDVQHEISWISYFSGLLNSSRTSSYDWASYNSSTFGTSTIDWIEINHGGETVFTNNRAEELGGAIYVGDSEISWSGSMLLERNSAQYGGALYLEDGVTVKANGPTTFDSNNALYDGGAIGATDDAGTYYGHSFLIVNNSMNFTNNMCGGNGGAIDFSDIYVFVDVRGKMVFSSNYAASSGGALFASRKEFGLSLTGVIFFNNTAEAGGAVFLSAVGTYEDGSSDDNSFYPYASTFNECRFDDNSASSTGGAIHSIAGRDVISGTSFTNNFANIGGALRISGMMIDILNSSFVENKSGEGGGSAISIGGVNSMEKLFFSSNGYHCSSDAFVDLNEVTSNQTWYETVCNGCGALSECSRCTTQDMNYVPACEEVFDHTDSQSGTATLDTLVLEAGYWRATKTSRQVLACFNKDACDGGLTGDPNYCSAGYEGPYCAVCSQGYAASLSYYGCSECSDVSSIVPSVCAVIFVAILGLLFVRHMVSIEGGHRTTWISVDRMKAVLPLQSFKIIIVSWQIVTQFSLVANVVYPKLYQRFLDVITLANFDLGWIPSAACIMDVDFHVELIAATVGPLLLVASLGFTYTVALHRNRGSERAMSAVRRKHANATIVIALLLYSMASSAVFRAFACDPLDDGKVYLRSDYRIECNSPKHKAFQIYAAFMLVVYPLGIPTLFALLLSRNRKALVDTSLRNNTRDLLQQSTSNLWKPYKPSAFYYEVVECGRRVMLTGVVVFIYPNTAAQIAITLAIAFIFALTSERLDPYDSHWDGWVSRIGHVIVALTMYVALLAKMDVSDEVSQSQALLAGVLVAAHIAMVLTVVAEAIVLVCSVRQRDLPRSRRRRTNYVVPLDDFSSIQRYSVDRRAWQYRDADINPHLMPSSSSNSRPIYRVHTDGEGYAQYLR